MALALLSLIGCSKNNEQYRDLIGSGEIYYPGVVAKTDYLAGNLRTMLRWSPSPDPKIVKYKILWNNRQDSMTVNAERLATTDTVKVIIPNLNEGTYNFSVYSIDSQGRSSIGVNINGVRVFGPKYQSGLFNRAYNVATPYLLDILKGEVKLQFNAPDSINTKTVIGYTDNSGAKRTVLLQGNKSDVVLPDFKFGTRVDFRSSYIPVRNALDTFTVSETSIFPEIARAGDITAVFIKNPGSPFQRGDAGSGKWGLPRDWQYNTAVVNQDNNKGGGWSSDNGGVMHFESKNWGDAPLINGKVFQTTTLPAGTYEMDFNTAGYGGTFNAYEVVAIGEGLPDITNVAGNSQVLASFSGNQGNMGGTHTLTFTLAAQTKVTFGWVVTTTTYTYLQFNKVALRIR